MPQSHRDVGFTGILLLLACSPTTEPVPQLDIRPLVTAEVAATLDAAGRFVFPPAHVQTNVGSIPENQARALGLAFVRMLSGSATFVQTTQLQRGGAPINFGGLVASERVEYAETPYAETGSEASDATRRHFGPYFIVRILDGDHPAISVAVSASATELRVVDGSVVFPQHSGNEFRSSGSPPDSGFVNPLSPERAVYLAAQATGARIAAIPQLLRPDWAWSVLYSRWKLVLDRPVAFRRTTTGETVESAEVYVGLAMNSLQVVGPQLLLLPAVTQPATDFAFDVPLRVKPAHPVRFDPVVVIR